MIKSFKHRALDDLWETGKSEINGKMHAGILRRPDHLHAATAATEMNLPEFPPAARQTGALFGPRQWNMVHRIRV
jgi:hypothetical protein